MSFRHHEALTPHALEGEAPDEPQLGTRIDVPPSGKTIT